MQQESQVLPESEPEINWAAVFVQLPKGAVSELTASAAYDPRHGKEQPAHTWGVHRILPSPDCCCMGSDPGGDLSTAAACWMLPDWSLVTNSSNRGEPRTLAPSDPGSGTGPKGGPGGPWYRAEGSSITCPPCEHRHNVGRIQCSQGHHKRSVAA